MTNREKFKAIFGFDYEDLQKYLVDMGWWNQDYRKPGVDYDWKNHKCRECKYLNLEYKTPSGYRCERPNYSHGGTHGHLKYGHTRACKGFEPREV